LHSDWYSGAPDHHGSTTSALNGVSDQAQDSMTGCGNLIG